MKVQLQAGACASEPSSAGVSSHTQARKRYRSMRAAFWHISQHEGVWRGLWAKGAVAHAQRSAVWAATQLSCYDTCKSFFATHLAQWRQQRGPAVSAVAATRGDNALVFFAASAVAGLVTVSLSHPLDLCKSRMMNESAGAPAYRGVVHCLVTVARQEGVRGLYKGWWPNYLRSGPHGATHVPSGVPSGALPVHGRLLTRTAWWRAVRWILHSTMA